MCDCLFVWLRQLRRQHLDEIRTYRAELVDAFRAVRTRTQRRIAWHCSAAEWSAECRLRRLGDPKGSTPFASILVAAHCASGGHKSLANSTEVLLASGGGAQESRRNGTGFLSPFDAKEIIRCADPELPIVPPPPPLHTHALHTTEQVHPAKWPVRHRPAHLVWSCVVLHTHGSGSRPTRAQSAFIRQIQTVALVSHIFAVSSPVFHPELQECLRTGDHAKLDKASFAAPAAPAAPGNTRAHAHPPY